MPVYSPGQAKSPSQQTAAQLKFRIPGAKAGSWPHTPWHHCELASRSICTSRFLRSSIAQTLGRMPLLPRRHAARPLRARQRVEPRRPRSAALRPRVSTPVPFAAPPLSRGTVWHHTTPDDGCTQVGLDFSLSSMLSYTLACRAAAPAWCPDAAQPLMVFGVSSGITHLMSALTHVWPDSHGLEKLDHLGIVATIIGTPMSCLMVRRALEMLTTSLSLRATSALCACIRTDSVCSPTIGTAASTTGACTSHSVRRPLTIGKLSLGTKRLGHQSGCVYEAIRMAEVKRHSRLIAVSDVADRRWSTGTSRLA